ncbi:unnamed protein product [Cylicocyclus nassatus]|uniref:Uncharacterized protein n=1 Tax=Cylicocyclus nassatus TaxID=53992 RepID=A0AA36HEE2_CYLNA|nr:unnamed protein product [Cylicocyclus nassatus]
MLLGPDDSDEDVTSDQLDRRRHLCQQRMLLAERQFNQIKLTIRDLKLKELEIKKTRIVNRTAPEFQERAKELRRHFQIKEEIAKARRTLSLDSLERRIAGQRHIARGNQVDNINNTQDLLRELIRERIMQEHRKLEKMNNFEHFHKSILDTPALFNRRSPSNWTRHKSWKMWNLWKNCVAIASSGLRLPSLDTIRYGQFKKIANLL